MTRPAINHYFANKFVLYQEVVEQSIGVIASQLAERAQPTTLVGRMRALMEAAMPASDRVRAAFFVTAMIDSQRHPEWNAPRSDFLQFTSDFIHGVVADAISKGELSSDVDAEALADMLLALCWGVVCYTGFVSTAERQPAITELLERLLTGRLARR